jgi:hypothetical protein
LPSNAPPPDQEKPLPAPKAKSKSMGGPAQKGQ